MKTMAGVLVLLLSFVIVRGAMAQGVAAGAVVVHVTCADTGAPARFVEVALAPVPAMDREAPPTQRQVDDTTDRNGDVEFRDVAPGAYFVDAMLAGYIQPLRAISVEALQSKDPAIGKLILDVVPHVTVESSATSRAIVVMKRGSAVSGRVAYDDGAPIESIAVRVIRVGDVDSSQGTSEGSIYKKGSSFQTFTDDRGMYRVAGISAGTYIASARIMKNHLKTRIVSKDNVTFGATQAGDVNLTFYALATTQMAKAQQFAVAPGEERQGVDLVADFTRLHSVGGYVNRHGTASPGAYVDLADVDDPENRHGTVADDQGYFRFDLLAEAHYRLTASPTRNVMDPGERKVSAPVPVVVTNADVLDLNVDLSGSAQ